MIPWIVLVYLLTSNLALLPPTVLPRSPLYASPKTREVPQNMFGMWGSFGDSLPADTTAVIDSTEVTDETSH